MKKWGILFLVCIGASLFYFLPAKSVLTFTETRTNAPNMYYIALNNEQQFELIFTHTIHRTDVIERYKVVPTGDIQLVSMEYEDVAIGMPSYAEEGQTLIYEDGVYTLSYEEAILPNFTLYIGDVDAELMLFSAGHIIDLKEQLVRGKSYVVEAKKLSLYEKMKGAEFK